MKFLPKKFTKKSRKPETKKSLKSRKPKNIKNFCYIFAQHISIYTQLFNCIESSPLPLELKLRTVSSATDKRENGPQDQGPQTFFPPRSWPSKHPEPSSKFSIQGGFFVNQPRKLNA